MKLIFCPRCEDIVRLYSRTTRKCQCGTSGGRYAADGLNATYWGNAIPLGILNDNFRRALERQPEAGLGERFEAFVIPKECPTMKRTNPP